MPDFDFFGYDAWKLDSGREGEEEDSMQYVTCLNGHGRLTRNPDGPCLQCEDR